jgi:hypothetical protein
VSWQAPSNDGGSTISGYTVTPYVGTTAQTPKIVTGSPLPTNAVVGGLATGTTYRFTVEGVNANGPGPASALSNAVTPVAAVVPSPPNGVWASPATNVARVGWTASSSDGDSAITGYTVTPYIGGAAQAPVHAGASATSATITGLTNGTAYTFRVTATNAVGDSAPSAASDPVTPRATIFELATPSTIDSSDPRGVELGVKFKADFDGSITGVRFYKAAANTGTHLGSLWSTGGTLLAQATFASEGPSGWQSATFASPVAITAGTTYVASYFTSTGHYSVDVGGLSASVVNPPLQTIANSTSVNGVYAYGSATAFPGNTSNAANYWVDVLYAPAATPAQVTGVTASQGGPAAANVSWTASAGPVWSYVVTPFTGSTALATKTVAGSPPATSTTMTGLTAGTAHTFTVRAVNQAGSGPESARSNSVTPVAATAASGAAVQLVDGDRPIVWFTVTPSLGATAQRRCLGRAGEGRRVDGRHRPRVEVRQGCDHRAALRRVQRYHGHAHHHFVGG